MLENNLHKDQIIQDTVQATYKQADHTIQYFIYGFFVFGILISPVYETWFVGISVGFLCLTAYLITKFAYPASKLLAHVTSLILSIMAAQFLYQMHGLFEMHFVFFIIVSIIILYQDWKVLIPLTLFVVIHHSLFAYLQNTGMNTIYFTQLEFFGTKAFIFHYGLFVVMVGVGAWWCVLIKSNTIATAIKNRLLEDQFVNTEKNISFARTIASGNLDAEYKLSNGDSIGASLLEMRKSLKESSILEKERHWATTGIAKIEELLRINSNNLEQLGYQVISTLVKYLNANQGAIFIIDEDQANKLNMKACYAYGKKKFLSKSIEFGEGLVGQAAIEKETIYITEIPQDYVQITSGLGQANPSAIVIVPLKFNEEVVGVVEIASFNNFSQYEIDFLEMVGESVASIVTSARINEKTSALLKDSQEKTEQLRSQEEEMRQNMEELLATQEEMERKGRETQEFLDLFDHFLLKAEFDSNGALQENNVQFKKLISTGQKYFDEIFENINWTDILKTLQDTPLYTLTLAVQDSQPNNLMKGYLKISNSESGAQKVTFIGHFTDQEVKYSQQV